MSEGTTAIGQKDDAAVTDPALNASMIALLKGMLTQLGGTGGMVVDLRETGGNALAVDDAAAGTTVPVPVGGAYNTTLPTYTNGDRTQLQFDSRGGLLAVLKDGSSASLAGVLAPTADGVAAATGVVVGRSQGMMFNGATWDREAKPNATSRILSAAASTNATSAKASAGNLHKIIAVSKRASDCFLKLYNKASAPTVGTDTPVMTICIPANASIDLDFDARYFATGIAYALTTGVADADTGALTAGDVIGLNLGYA